MTYEYLIDPNWVVIDFPPDKLFNYEKDINYAEDRVAVGDYMRKATEITFSGRRAFSTSAGLISYFDALDMDNVTKLRYRSTGGVYSGGIGIIKAFKHFDYADTMREGKFTLTFIPAQTVAFI